MPPEEENGTESEVTGSEDGSVAAGDVSEGDASEDGWISEEHMEDWENQYQAYHSLGENGILDSRRAELLKLPNGKPNKEEQDNE